MLRRQKMRGYNRWNFKPYVPYDERDIGMLPYICRLAPGESAVSGELFDHGCAGMHKLCYSERGSDAWVTMSLTSTRFFIGGLKEDTEYLIYAENENGEKSRERIFKTGAVPGTVVNYIHPEDEQYAFSGRFCCSPSIVRCPSGTLLASMDLYEGKRPQNLTLIFRSQDNGATWSYLTDLFPCFWGTMFYHRGRLYMLGTTTEYGDLQIGASDDEGATWTTPVSIFRGSGHSNENGFQKAPNPVLSSGGRLWSSIEYGSWMKKTFCCGVVSIDEDADLLVPENWCCTELLPFDERWPNQIEGNKFAIEGNIIEKPDGSLTDILRYGGGKAVILDVDASSPEGALSFSSISEFPMGHSKFEIKRRDEDGMYYAVGNRLPQRNILSVYRSHDLKDWELVCDAVNREDLPKEKNAFQYPAFIFDGDDILILSRTAMNGAKSFHDNNYLTFHRIALK